MKRNEIRIEIFFFIVLMTLFTQTKSKPNELYARELTKLKSFNNSFLDFRIYFCTGVFLRNKENHELYFRHVYESFPQQFDNIGKKKVYEKFMAINIMDCLRYIQKYDDKNFYLKIREFAEPGN